MLGHTPKERRKAKKQTSKKKSSDHDDNNVVDYTAEHMLSDLKDWIAYVNG